MTDRADVRRATGWTYDDNTGQRVPTYTVLFTDTPCRVQQTTATATAVNPGEDYQLLVRNEVHFPMSVTGLAPSDEIIMTVSRDPDLTDAVFLVRELFGKTFATARRVGVTRRTS